jgi:hypothetical protein
MTPNLKHINKSIYALVTSVLPSLIICNLNFQAVALDVHRNFNDVIPNLQLKEKQWNCTY